MVTLMGGGGAPLFLCALGPAAWESGPGHRSRQEVTSVKTFVEKMLVTLYRSLQNFKIEKIDNTRVSCLVASTLHYKRVCLLLVAPSIALSVLFLTVSYIVYHIPCFKLISNTAHFHYTFDSSATITPLTGRTVVSTRTCLVDYSYN